MATGQELTPGQNAWPRGEEGKHARATGQELTPGQNALSSGEEGKHAMATGQELTPGQNASLDIRCELISSTIVINSVPSQCLFLKKGRI